MLVLAGGVLGAWLLFLVAAVALIPDGATQASNRGAPPNEGAAAGAPDDAHRPEHHARPLPDEMLYSYDIEDERIVIGLSENVFLATVTRKVGEERAETSIPGDPGRPQLQFRVRVVGSAKATGPAPLRPGKTATVNQEVGVDPESGRIVPVGAAYCGQHRRDALLRPGSSYVFSTYYEPGRNLHTLIAQPTGAVPVASEEEGRALIAAYRRYEAEEIDPATGRIEGAKPCE